MYIDFIGLGYESLLRVKQDLETVLALGCRPCFVVRELGLIVEVVLNVAAVAPFAVRHLECVSEGVRE